MDIEKKKAKLQMKVEKLASLREGMQGITGAGVMLTTAAVTGMAAAMGVGHHVATVGPELGATTWAAIAGGIGGGLGALASMPVGVALEHVVDNFLDKRIMTHIGHIAKKFGDEDKTI